MASDNSVEGPTRIEAHHYEQGYLKYLNRSIEMGDCASLKWRIEKWGPSLRISLDEAVRLETAEIERKSTSMFEIEGLYGEGSLLNLDHPSVQSLSKMSAPVFPEKLIEAAKLYRTFTDEGPQ